MSSPHSPISAETFQNIRETEREYLQLANFDRHKRLNFWRTQARFSSVAGASSYSLAVFLHTRAGYGHTTCSCHTSPEQQHSGGHHWTFCCYLVSCTPSSDLTVDALLIKACCIVEWAQVTRAVQIVAVTHATQPANHTASVTCPTPAMSCGMHRRCSWVSLEACGQAGRSSNIWAWSQTSEGKIIKYNRQEV